MKLNIKNISAFGSMVGGALGGAVDSALSVPFPGMALKRTLNRARYQQLSTYAAAEKSRRTSDWTGKTKSADAAIIPDLAILNGRTRQLVRDNPHARSIVNSYGRNVIGCGIRPAHAARFKQGGKARTEFNTNVDAYFERWANSPRFCDLAGRLNLWQMMRMAIEECVTVGEFYFVLNYEDNGPDMVDLKLQCIESEQLDTTLIRSPKTGNRVIAGIEVDDNGKAVAYWFRKQAQHPFASMRVRSERVTEDRVIHLYNPERCNQTRGVTWLAPVMRKLRDLEQYDDAQLWAARMEACVGLAIEASPGGDRIGGMGDQGDDTDADGAREIEFQPGMVAELAHGEKVQFLNPQRPGGQYTPFVQAQLRSIAAGVGLSYEQVARDFSNGNFSSQRQALLEDRRQWKPIQQWFINAFCRPIHDEFVNQAVLSNLIDAPDSFFIQGQDWLKCEWMPDGWEWIDPAKQAAAAKLMLQMFLTTRRDLSAELGKDYNETLAQWKTEIDIAKEFGIPLPELQEDKKNKQAQQGKPGEPKPRGAEMPPEANDSDKDKDRKEKEDNQGAEYDPITAAVLADAIDDPMVVAALGME